MNVVPGDEARNQVPNPIVEVEQLMASIDTRKRDIATSLRAGDTRTAQRTLAGVLTDLNTKREEVKHHSGEASLRTRLDDAARDLLKLADDVRSENANYAGKSVMNSYAATSRGRNQRGPQAPTQRRLVA